MVNARVRGEPFDARRFAEELREDVGEVVRRQISCGIDAVDDGELSKPGFADFVVDRLSGFEGENPDRCSHPGASITPSTTRGNPAANPAHAHEWEIWPDVRLPDGKILIPGLIDSTTNSVEHPQLVAQRITQFSDLVGRENIVAGTDCGFGTMARVTPRVHPVVMWAKLATLAEGARLASARLWA